MRRALVSRRAMEVSRDNLGGMDREEEGPVGLFGCGAARLFPGGLWWGERILSVRNADKSKKAGGGWEVSNVGISGADQNWFPLGET